MRLQPWHSTALGSACSHPRFSPISVFLQPASMPAIVNVPILPPFVVAASTSVALLLQLFFPGTLPPLLRIGIVSR